MNQYKVNFVTTAGVPYTGVLVDAPNMGQVVPNLIEEGFEIRMITMLTKVEAAK